jgi:hypothetical protein
VTFSETTEEETNWAMLLILAPVAPISIELLPLPQLPLFEANKALLLLSMQALTTGTLLVFATAKPLTVTAPITNPIKYLENPVFIPLQKLMPDHMFYYWKLP